MGCIECICCEKFQCNFKARTFALIAPLQPVFQWVYCRNETFPNAPRALWNAPKHEFRGPMGWIGCSRSEKLQSDFVARTFALIAPVQPVLHWLYFVTKQSQMHPNTMKRTKTWVYGPMVWIWCACCEKFWSDLVAQTFALIAPV